MSERFAGYQILKPLVRGGMGALYQAYDPKQKQPVLIKRVAFHRRSEELNARFEDEIAIARKLKHPHLARLCDSGEVEGERYLTFEWLSGQNLDAISEKSRRYDRPIPLGVALRICRQVAAALEYAHGAEIGFVHRDVSPANIHVGYDGTTHLLDYGLALSTVKSVRTLPGLTGGTLGFASPEQGRGETVDVRSDVYSLGAVLWYLVAGTPSRNPFHSSPAPGDPNQTIGKLSSLRPVPELLDELCTSALEIDRERRLPSATDLGEALDELLEVEPATAADVAAFVESLFPGKKEMQAAELERLITTATRPRRRSSTAPLFVVGSALFLIALGVGLSLRNQRLHDQADRATLERTQPLPTPLASTARAEPPTFAPQPLKAPTARVERHFTPPQPEIRTTKPATTELPAAESRLREAHTLALQGKLAAAFEIYDELQSQPATRPLAFAGRAEAELIHGQYGRAIEAATRAIDLGAGASAYLTRAHAKLRLGEAAEAEHDFRAVLALHPRNREARAGLEEAETAARVK